jgi:thioredoxin
MKKSLFLLALSIFFLMNSCHQNGTSSNFNLEAKEFAEKINELPTAPIIDVRTADEFSNGHLAKAKNIDWNSNAFETSIQELNKENPVFVYCLSGGRSSAAAEKMRAIGFKNVYELEGGIMKWRAANLPEENVNSTGMTSEEFKKLITSDRKVLIDFYAEWCGPCKKMAPYLETMKTEMADSLIVVRINADINQKIAKELSVDALPTLLLYKNGEIIWRNTGYITKENLIDSIKNH